MTLKSTLFLLLLFLVSCVEKQSETTQIPLFSVTDFPTVGPSFKHYQPLTQAFEIHETLGSGVAVIDINNDGIYEIFFSQFEKNHTSSVLYQRIGNKYEDITQSSGLGGLNSIMGAAVADVNNDGWNDILIYGLKQLHLMINNRGHFSAATLPKLPKNSFYSSATFFHANNDQHLDIWLSRYVDITSIKSCKGNDGLAVYCSPSAYPFQSDILLINHQGTKYSQAPQSMINIPPSPSLGVVAADFNQDQLQDIFVANDGQNNFLFTQQQDGSFIEEAELKSLSSNLAGLKEASMGIAIGDYDNNGLIDLYLTHLEQETNTLYKNEGSWFIDVTNQSKLGINSRVQTGFGTGFYDLDGDNWLDLFVTNGRIQPRAYQQRKNLTEQFKEKPLLLLNKQGKFKNLLIFDDFKGVGRGLAFVDLDNDGDKDLISNNNNQRPTVFINNSTPNLWYGLDIRCHNRSDTSARVDYTIKQNANSQLFYKTIHSDGSYASANDPRVILYLNPNDILGTVNIKFSDGSAKEVSKELLENQYNKISCLGTLAQP